MTAYRPRISLDGFGTQHLNRTGEHITLTIAGADFPMAPDERLISWRGSSGKWVTACTDDGPCDDWDPAVNAVAE